jgi:hypothetical protein
MWLVVTSVRSPYNNFRVDTSADPSYAAEIPLTALQSSGLVLTGYASYNRPKNIMRANLTLPG